jgi:hypothetical protein
MKTQPLAPQPLSTIPWNLIYIKKLARDLRAISPNYRASRPDPFEPHPFIKNSARYARYFPKLPRIV